MVSESLLSNKDREAKKEEKKRRKSLAAQHESSLAQGRRLSLTPLSHSLHPADSADMRRHSAIFKTYSLPTADRDYIPQSSQRRVSVRGPIRGFDSPFQESSSSTSPARRRHGIVRPLSEIRDQTADDKFNAWIIRNKMTSSLDLDREDDERRAYGMTI